MMITPKNRTELEHNMALVFEDANRRLQLDKPDARSILVWENGSFLIYYKNLELGMDELLVVDESGSLRWDVLIILVEGGILVGI